MMAALRWLALTLLVAAATHAAIIFGLPRIIMGEVLRRAEPVNSWSFSPQITPRTQRIVRSSPDLAYAVCAFDLSGGPVRMYVAPSRRYASLALYTENTDAFFTANDRQIPAEGLEIMLVAPGQPAPKGEWRVVRSPSLRGLALDRRLAPTDALFAEADLARRGNVCEPLSLLSSTP